MISPSSVHAVICKHSGNVLRRIGQQDRRVVLRAGIGTATVRRLRVNGNDLADIGPAAMLRLRQRAKGFALTAPSG